MTKKSTVPNILLHKAGLKGIGKKNQLTNQMNEIKTLITQFKNKGNLYMDFVI